MKYMAMIFENGFPYDDGIAHNLDIPQAVKILRNRLSRMTWPEESVGYVLPDKPYKQRDDGVPYGWVGCVHLARYDSKNKPVFAYTVRKAGESLDKVSEDYIVKSDGTLLSVNKPKW